MRKIIEMIKIGKKVRKMIQKSKTEFEVYKKNFKLRFISNSTNLPDKDMKVILKRFTYHFRFSIFFNSNSLSQ